jgi:hypothetical protein
LIRQQLKRKKNPQVGSQGGGGQLGTLDDLRSMITRGSASQISAYHVYKQNFWKISLKNKFWILSVILKLCQMCSMTGKTWK